ERRGIGFTRFKTDANRWPGPATCSRLPSGRGVYGSRLELSESGDGDSLQRASISVQRVTVLAVFAHDRFEHQLMPRAREKGFGERTMTNRRVRQCCLCSDIAPEGQNGFERRHGVLNEVSFCINSTKTVVYVNNKKNAS